MCYFFLINFKVFSFPFTTLNAFCCCYLYFSALCSISFLNLFFGLSLIFKVSFIFQCFFCSFLFLCSFWSSYLPYEHWNCSVILGFIFLGGIFCDSGWVRVPLIFLLNTQRFHEGKACKRVQLPLHTPISDPQRSHLHTLVSTWLLAARWSLSASCEASAWVPVLLQALSSPGFQAAGCPTCLRGSIGSGEPTG